MLLNNTWMILIIDINKAQGPDNISGVVLKKCSEALCQPLSFSSYSIIRNLLVTCKTARIALHFWIE